jgi:hypothetical protein
MAAAIRARAVRLYRAALRSASRCPDPQHKRDALCRIRQKFFDGRHDTTHSLSRLQEGEEEVAFLDYCHGVRECKTDPAGRSAPAYDDVLKNLRLTVSGEGRMPLPDAKNSAANTNHVSSTYVPSAEKIAAGPATGGVQRRKRFCGNCGIEFLEAGNFCTECGAQRS